MIKVNGENINVTMFPDNTSQVWQLSDKILSASKFEIEWKFDSEGELFHLQQLVSLLRTGRVPCKINLHMPYMPYGRQDKTISNSSTFALQTFACVINGLRFDKVSTLDAHSDVPRTLINNFDDHSPRRCIASALKAVSKSDDIEYHYNVKLAYPDDGAVKRYAKEGNYIVGNKVRDQETGYITEYNIKGEPKGKDILIIDDICDGGMTFKLMAEELYKQGANSVHLYVSHGIFSKGLKPLKDSGIQRIFTKDGEVISHNSHGHITKRFK